MADLLAVADLAVRAEGFAARLPALQLGRGEAAALFGPSGGGKTSLLLALAGLHAPALQRTGQVWAAGEPVPAHDGARRRHLLRQAFAYALQDGIQALDPLRPVGAQLQAATGCTAAALVAQLQAFAVAAPAALLQRHPHQISGGEAQRALLAAALLRPGAVLVLDEPTANLDGAAATAVLEAVARAREGGRAVLCATHDLAVVDRLGARLLLQQGQAFVAGTAAQLRWPELRRRYAGGEVLLQAQGLTVQHGGAAVLQAVDLQLRRGTVTAVLGASGAGKTTLLRALAGLLPATAGTVQRPKARTAVQLLWQDAAGSLTPRTRLRSLLAETAAPGFASAAEAAALGLAAQLDRDTGALSGGERRRAALLRSLSVQPTVLLLDEPTASLDRDAALLVLRRLFALQAGAPLAILIATHDKALAAACADATFRLQAGTLQPC